MVATVLCSLLLQDLSKRSAAASQGMFVRLADPTGLMLNGWAQQFDVIAASHAFRPLTKRKAKIMWRGRASDEPRDEVRCCLLHHLLEWTLLASSARL